MKLLASALIICGFLYLGLTALMALWLAVTAVRGAVRRMAKTKGETE